MHNVTKLIGTLALLTAMGLTASNALERGLAEREKCNINYNGDFCASTPAEMLALLGGE